MGRFGCAACRRRRKRLQVIRPVTFYPSYSPIAIHPSTRTSTTLEHVFISVDLNVNGRASGLKTYVTRQWAL